MAKTAPYWLATGTLSLLATGTINRMAAPVTFTPATAVPLGLMLSVCNYHDSQPTSKSLADAKHMLFCQLHKINFSYTLNDQL